MIHSNRKSPTPHENRQILPKKAEGRTGIRTRPIRAEVCCSTACATTRAHICPNKLIKPNWDPGLQVQACTCSCTMYTNPWEPGIFYSALVSSDLLSPMKSFWGKSWFLAANSAPVFFLSRTFNHEIFQTMEKKWIISFSFLMSAFVNRFFWCAEQSSLTSRWEGA